MMKQRVLGEGHFADEKRFCVVWPAGATETPIKVNLNGTAYALAPNDETIVPESLKLLFDDSGFDVITLDEAVAEEDAPDNADDGKAAAKPPKGSASA